MCVFVCIENETINTTFTGINNSCEIGVCYAVQGKRETAWWAAYFSTFNPFFIVFNGETFADKNEWLRAPNVNTVELRAALI